jgi:hypothetical protein
MRIAAIAQNITNPYLAQVVKKFAQFLNHKSATDNQKDEAYLKRNTVEAAAISRFGLAEHRKKLLARHPDVDKQAPN